MMYDKVIIGGGFSGLYAAYRLSLDPKFQRDKILLVDSGDILGGIIKTQIHEGFKMEHAAMRFKQILHPNLFKLFSKLDISFCNMIKHEPSYDGYLSKEYNLLSEKYKKVILEDKESSKAFGPALILHYFAIKIILKDALDFNKWFNYSRRKRTELLRKHCFDGKLLWKQSHSDLIKRVLSEDAFSFLVKYAFHYLAFNKGINGVDGILLVLEQLLSKDECASEVENGTEELIKKLAEHITSSIDIKMQARVNSLIPLKNGVKVVITDKLNNYEEFITCKSVIVAVNVSGLKSIAGLPMNIKKNLDALVPIPVVKIFVLMKDLHLTNTIDKECNFQSDRVGMEVFHFHRERSKKSMVLFYIRNDYESVKAILNDSHKTTPNCAQPSLLEDFIITKLKIYFPTYTDPQILDYAVLDWGTAPFDGVAFGAKAGVDLEVVNEAFSNFSLSPYSSGSVHVCSDSFSSCKGHLEGCIESVERVLGKVSHFDNKMLHYTNSKL